MAPAAVAGNVPGTEDVRPGIAQNSAADSLARAAAYEHGEGVPKDAKIAAAGRISQCKVFSIL